MGVKFFRNILGNLIIGVVVVAVFAIAFGGDVQRVSGQRLSPIYNGQSQDKVCLMVNICSNSEYIEQMLNIFDEFDVKATFFVTGMWAMNNDTVLQKIYGRGHEIGNHGYFHKSRNNLSAEENYREIKVTHDLVKSILGADMTLFTPPSGIFSQTTLEQAQRLGYKTVIGTHDTQDDKNADASQIYSNAVRDTRGGDFIQLHAVKNTITALRNIIKTLNGKGLTPVTLSQVLSQEA